MKIKTFCLFIIVISRPASTQETSCEHRTTCFSRRPKNSNLLHFLNFVSDSFKAITVY